MKTTTNLSERAFTLIEVLIALALTVLLLGATFSFLFNLGTQRERLIQRARADRGAALFLERLEADLFCCLAGSGSLGAGVKGDASSMTLLSRGVDLDSPVVNGVSADLQRSVVNFDPGRGAIMYARGAPTNSANAPENIATGVADLAFRYFDGHNWRSSFDSLAANSLPVAVEVSVWLGRPVDPANAAPRSAPDFTRVISIADGPVTSWKEGS